MGHAHAPATHIWPAGHALPQRPQCALLVCTSTQLPEQAVRPDDAHAHVPALQTSPAPHTVVQLPQC